MVIRLLRSSRGAELDHSLICGLKTLCYREEIRAGGVVAI